jgi:hypothetical protein
MRTASLARWIGAAGVTAALALITIPSLAAVTPQVSGGPTIRPYLSGIVVSPGGDTTGRSPSVGFEVTGLGNTQVHNLVVTLDTGKLPAGATLSIFNAFEWDCATAAGSVVCSSTQPVQTFAYGGPSVTLGTYLSLDIAASASAAFGLGSLTVSATADGLTGLNTTVPVGIAQPVTLTGGPQTSFTGPPGSTYSTRWSVTNAGTTTVHRVTLWINGDTGFDLTKHYSNCLYDPAYAAGAYCTFDNDLTPGVTYELSEPVSVKIAANHVAPFLGATEADWLTPLDLSTYGPVASTPGTDGPLNLVVQSTQAAAPPLTQPGLPQTDQGYTYGSYVDVSVSGVNEANLAAVGSSVRTHGNGSVAITVGLTDQGPAAASMSRSGDPLSVMTVTIPSGTTATSVPVECWPYVSGQPDSRQFGMPGFGQYECLVYQNLAVQQSYLLPFTLQVPAGARSYSGSVAISNGATPAGSVAPILITVAPAVPPAPPVQPSGRRPTGMPSWPMAVHGR